MRYLNVSTWLPPCVVRVLSTSLPGDLQLRVHAEARR